jgi:hypothetical protein
MEPVMVPSDRVCAEVAQESSSTKKEVIKQQRLLAIVEDYARSSQTANLARSAVFRIADSGLSARVSRLAE